MRTRRIIISSMILFGVVASLIGFSVPPVQAHTAEEIVFHYYGGYNIAEDDIPEDSVGLIYFEGTGTHAIPNWGIDIQLQNLCDDGGTPPPTPTPTPTLTPCPYVDIYFKFEFDISWINGFHLAPHPFYHLQDWDPIIPEEGEHCGSDGPSGSCHLEYEGVIPAADIFHGVYQEEVGIGFSAYIGATLVVNYKITLATAPIEEPGGCGGQYSIGAALGSFTLAATNSSGQNLQTLLGMDYPQPGDWYVVRVISGHWHNNGSGPELRTLGIKTGVTGTWFALEYSPGIGCADTETDTYYLQMGSTLPTFLRVYDTDGNWSNTGTMAITIYSVASYTPYPSGCELQYSVGDLLEQKTVEGDWSNGWPLMRPWYLPWDPHALGGWGSDAYYRYYMLETTGGPANLGASTFTWDADLAIRASETDINPSLWYEIQTAPFVTCVVQTDIVGHVKVFFALDKQTDPTTIIKYFYAFRVRDTGSYLDNSGNLSYRLYQATDMQNNPPGEIPGPDGCRNFHHDAVPTGSIVINGNDSDGSLTPTLLSGSMYALEVVDGPWKDNSVDSYNVQLSSDDGDSWVDLKDYPYLLCSASADGNHIIIYIYGAAGKIWRVRADDGDSNFTNNTLTIGMDIYPGHGDVDPYPNCKDKYSLTKVPLSDEVRKVPGNIAAGKIVPGISKDTLYSIEITDESKWYETHGGTGSYLVDISQDGTTWYTMENYPSRLCVELIGDGDRVQLYFTAQTNAYYLRVRDTNGDFLSNEGYVMFNLYTASDNENPTPIPPEPPPEWVVACNEKYARPNGFITYFDIGPILDVTLHIPVPRVGEWLDFVRNSITFYLAWCPQHTAAIQSIGQEYMDKEPMKTMKDLLDFIKFVKDLLKSYQVTAEEGGVGLTSQEPYMFSDTEYIGTSGGESQYTVPITIRPWDMFLIGPMDPATDFWYGGKIDMSANLGTSDLSTQDDYRGMCVDKFYQLFGIGTDPFCRFMAMLRYEHIVTYLLFGLDCLIIIWFLFKFMPYWAWKVYHIIKGHASLIDLGGKLQ